MKKVFLSSPSKTTMDRAAAFEKIPSSDLFYPLERLMSGDLPTTRTILDTVLLTKDIVTTKEYRYQYTAKCLKHSEWDPVCATRGGRENCHLGLDSDPLFRQKGGVVIITKVPDANGNDAGKYHYLLKPELTPLLIQTGLLRYAYELTPLTGTDDCVHKMFFDFDLKVKNFYDFRKTVPKLLYKVIDIITTILDEFSADYQVDTSEWIVYDSCYCGNQATKTSGKFSFHIFPNLRCTSKTNKMIAILARKRFRDSNPDIIKKIDEKEPGKCLIFDHIYTKGRNLRLPLCKKTNVSDQAIKKLYYGCEDEDGETYAFDAQAICPVFSKVMPLLEDLGFDDHEINEMNLYSRSMISNQDDSYPFYDFDFSLIEPEETQRESPKMVVQDNSFIEQISTEKINLALEYLKTNLPGWNWLPDSTKVYRIIGRNKKTGQAACPIHNVVHDNDNVWCDIDKKYDVMYFKCHRDEDKNFHVLRFGPNQRPMTPKVDITVYESLGTSQLQWAEYIIINNKLPQDIALEIREVNGRQTQVLCQITPSGCVELNHEGMMKLATEIMLPIVREISASKTKGSRSWANTLGSFPWISGVSKILLIQVPKCQLPRVLSIRQREDWIPTEDDQMVNILTGEIQQLDPLFGFEHKTRIRMIPFERIPLEDKQIVDYYIDSSFPSDESVRNRLMACIAMSFSGKIEQAESFFLFGPSRAGKSVLINLLEHMGGDYSRVISERALLASTTGHDADIGDTRTSRIVLLHDYQKPHIEAAKIIPWTERKRVIREINSKKVTFDNQSHLWVAMNPTYGLNLDSEQKVDRITIFQFNKPAGRDHMLENKLQTPGAVSYFFQKCLQMFIKTQERGILPRIESMEMAKKAIRDESDPIRIWFYENTRHHDSSHIKTTVAYKEYREWCLATGTYCVNQRHFCTDIKKLEGIEVKNINYNDNGHRRSHTVIMNRISLPI